MFAPTGACLFLLACFYLYWRLFTPTGDCLACVFTPTDTCLFILARVYLYWHVFTTTGTCLPPLTRVYPHWHVFTLTGTCSSTPDPARDGSKQDDLYDNGKTVTDDSDDCRKHIWKNRRHF